MTTETRPPLAARANAYNVLARCLAMPRDWTPELARDVATRLPELGPPFGELAVRLADGMEAAFEEREAVDLAYARLFLGPLELDAPPYESTYREAGGHLLREVSLSVARAYAEAGLEPAPGPREAPDHATHELEFLYYLAFRQLSSEDPLWVERRTAFWREHAGTWLGVFAGMVRDAGRHPVYDTLGELLARFVSDEQERYVE